ncbi:MAG: complex I NDUFA9 subunit family protein [Candidatus Schekmanbacteria bacterium]|nr:MAG: complex I NDUFA9 subunit family protein [Candidatus Schekmanbacteria bacterium]
MAKIKKIFITGATGFVGRSIVRAGKKEGYTFACLVRNLDRAKKILTSNSCTFIKGDITNIGSLKKVIEKNDAVINLVGIISETKKSSFDEIHFKGAKNLIDASKSSGIKKFIQMSALGARKDGKTAYHITKWKAEDYLQKSGLNYTIFKPSVIFGKDDKFINLFIKLLKLSPIFPALGKGTLEPVWVEDVANSFINALNNPKSDRQIIELGSGKVYTHTELLKTLCQKLHIKRLIFPMPTPIAKTMALLSEMLLPSPLLTREQLIMLDEKNQVSNRNAETIFNISYKTLEDYLEEL